MYRENNKGPRTVPWGTPDKTGAQSDFTPFTTTRCCLKPYINIFSGTEPVPKNENESISENWKVEIVTLLELSADISAYMSK